MIRPHGGKLVNRVLEDAALEKALERSKDLPKITLDEELVKDVKNIARGVYSPLEGFMCKADFENVLHNMRLADGLPWTIPVVLDVSEEDAGKLNDGDEILLADETGNPIAILHLEDKYTYDKNTFAKEVFRTEDAEHPGVSQVNSMKPVLLGGKVDLLENSKEPFYEYNLDPQETRILFKELGWKTVVGFQTRNPPHRAHEHLQKTALETVDGLFINPVAGKKKAGDFRDEIILDAYNALLKNHFPKNRAVMSILPMQMRYAGPREAIFHAIIRKNFGCTHFIVGRDHAGVGNYYGTYDAQEIFDQLEDIGIIPLKLEHAAYCKMCKAMVTSKTCPHDKENWVPPSGTEIRRIVSEKRTPSEELMWPDVAEVLMNAEDPYVK